MSTIYAPGTVAVATVRGVPNVRVLRTPQVHEHHVFLWATGTEVESSTHFKDEHVTDVRPLVVLDLADLAPASFTPPSAAEASLWLRRLADKWVGSCAADVARAIADQIEAQTKPPRIPEPGLWGVVEASYPEARHGQRLTFLRDATGTDDDWLTLTRVPTDRNRGRYDWDHLVDPVLIRDGIEDES